MEQKSQKAVISLLFIGVLMGALDILPGYLISMAEEISMFQHLFLQLSCHHYQTAKYPG